MPRPRTPSPADKKPEATATKSECGSPADSAKADAASNKGADKAPAETAKKDDAAAQEAPGTTAALPDPAAAAAPPTAGVADAALPPADAIVAAVRQKIPEAAKGSNADDVAALAAFYEELSGPAIWVSTSGLTAKGKAVVEEIGKADDWGLRASDFDVPHLGSGTLTPDAAAEAEIKIGQAVLKYARYARGGRINPASISAAHRLSPAADRAEDRLDRDRGQRTQPDAYLRSLHPKHEQFERLRQALLKLRNASGKEEDDGGAAGGSGA